MAGAPSPRRQTYGIRSILNLQDGYQYVLEAAHRSDLAWAWWLWFTLVFSPPGSSQYVCKCTVGRVRCMVPVTRVCASRGRPCSAAGPLHSANRPHHAPSVSPQSTVLSDQRIPPITVKYVHHCSPLGGACYCLLNGVSLILGYKESEISQGWEIRNGLIPGYKETRSCIGLG